MESTVKTSTKFKIRTLGEGVYQINLEDLESSADIYFDFKERKINISYKGRDGNGNEMFQRVGLVLGGTFSYESEETRTIRSSSLKTGNLPIKKGIKYVPSLRSMMTEDGTIKDEDLRRVFKGNELIGVKNFLASLKRNGYLQKNDGNYKFLDPAILYKVEPLVYSLKSTPRKGKYVKYMARIRNAVVDGRINEEKIDEIFKSANERRGVKQVLNFLEKKRIIERISTSNQKFVYKILKPEEFNKLCEL